MLTPQAVAQLRQQGIVRSLAEVVDLDFVRQAFAAGCTNADEARLLTQGPSCHDCLGTNLIARIDDGVDPGWQESRPVFRLDKLLNALHNTVRVDLRDTFPHGLHLGLPQRGIERMNLPVDVGFGDVIEVDQRQAAHTAACQGLNRPGPHATDTDNGNVCGTDTLRARRTAETIQATEAPRKVHVNYSDQAFKPPHLILESGQSARHDSANRYETCSAKRRHAG